jgi:RecA-family ATPase
MMADAGREESGEAALTARWLHEQGFHVIPCGSPAEEPPPWFVQRHETLEDARAAWPKTPRIKWKEYQSRQPTDEEFERWERTFIGCNWAVLTGTPGGVDVLDSDDPAAVEFLQSGTITRAVWVVETAKGEHHWYRCNPAAQMTSGVGKTARLDVRGRGGYVIAPGSVHATGHRYRLRIADGFSDDPAELTMLTAEDQAKVHRFNQGRENAQNSAILSGSGNLNFDSTKVAPAIDLEEGVVGKGRNSRTNRFTGSLIAGKKSLQEILEIVKAQNARNVDERGRPNPLSEGELLTTVASTIRTHLENHPDQPVPLEPGTNVQAAIAKEILKGLSPVDIGSLQSMPIRKVDWVWEGWIPKRYASGCFAEGGVGKSLAFLQLAICRAAQIPYIDGKIPPPGKTLLLFCEDDIDIVNARVHRIMARYGIDWSDIKGKVFILCRVGDDNTMMTFDQKDVGTLTPFWYQIRDLIAETGVDFIVVDTRNDVFAGKEIDNSQARQFVQRALTSLAQEFNLAAVFLAHVSASSKESGSGMSGGTAWRDTARSQIHISRDTPQSQKIVFELKKANHAQAGSEVAAWNDSGFLMPAAQIDLTSKNEDQARADFVAILERQRTQDQYYSLDKRAKAYAPTEFSRISNQLKKWKTTRASDFEAAMEQLIDMGVVTRWADQYGNVKHRAWLKEWDEQAT